MRNVTGLNRSLHLPRLRAPGRFKVVRNVREAFSCRACECVVQAPAPHHVIARGRAGAGLLAHIVVLKFDDHLPLYRQAEIYSRAGVELATSTFSSWVGATAAALRREVMTSPVLHGDDTPVAVLAPGTGRTKSLVRPRVSTGPRMSCRKT